MAILRDPRQGGKDESEEDTQKARLFERLVELRTRQGKGWKEIAQILREEGYEEGGRPLTDNALRKRYTKRGRTETSVTPPLVSEPVSEQEEGGYEFDRFEKTRMESSLRQFEGGAALPALSPENALASSIASLVSLNSQLVEQVQQSHRMIERLANHLEEQEPKTTHTGIDTEQPVTSRELLELLKELTAGRGQQMQYIEEEKTYLVSKEEVLELLEEKVQDRVDAELRTMLSEEGSFSEELAHLIDLRLKTLFSGGEPVATTPHGGPGRGRKGRTHKKFSASLEEGLFERVRSLPGQFSRHLANALSSYLSVMEDKKED